MPSERAVRISVIVDCDTHPNCLWLAAPSVARPPVCASVRPSVRPSMCTAPGTTAATVAQPNVISFPGTARLAPRSRHRIVKLQQREKSRLVFFCSQLAPPKASTQLSIYLHGIELKSSLIGFTVAVVGVNMSSSNVSTNL